MVNYKYDFLGGRTVMFSKMKWYFTFIFSFLSIIGVMYLIHRQLHHHVFQSEKTLAEVKTYFRNVVGSYILNETVTYETSEGTFTVYQGGITTQSNDKRTYYDFYADANNGEIIDIIERTS